MKPKTISKAEAAALIDEIDQMTDSDFINQVNKWSRYEVDEIPHEYELLRFYLVNAFKEGLGNDYAVDLNVGFALYAAFSSNELGFKFTNTLANDDDFWRYLTCCIIPDLTYKRYPKPGAGDARINKKRFYSHTRRIWPKTLWWYIHLSWQGDEQSTREVLGGLGTDTISQLIERTGKGYRLDLMREIMYSYSRLPNKSAELFKRIRAKNTVDCKTIEPALTQGGEHGYIQNVFFQLDCLGE